MDCNRKVTQVVVKVSIRFSFVQLDLASVRSRLCNETVWSVNFHFVWHTLLRVQSIVEMVSDKVITDRMVWLQMDWDQLRNVSNLDQVEPNRIMDSIYACIRFYSLTSVENIACMLLPFDNIRYSFNSSSNVNYFFLWLMWSVVYMKLIATTVQMLHMDWVRSEKCSETELNRLRTKMLQDQDPDLFWHYNLSLFFRYISERLCSILKVFLCLFHGSLFNC